MQQKIVFKNRPFLYELHTKQTKQKRELDYSNSQKQAVYNLF